jgi:hypothetical protein
MISDFGLANSSSPASSFANCSRRACSREGDGDDDDDDDDDCVTSTEDASEGAEESSLRRDFVLVPTILLVQRNIVYGMFVCRRECKGFLFLVY